VSFINATSTGRAIPQHWRRSLAAYLLLLAIVAAANVHLVQTRGRADAGRESRVADANGVTNTR
jgi:hypothetical protein